MPAETDNEMRIAPAFEVAAGTAALSTPEAAQERRHEEQASAPTFDPNASNPQSARAQIGKAEQGLAKTNAAFARPEGVGGSDGDDDREDRRGTRAAQDLLLQQQAEQVRVQQERIQRAIARLDHAVEMALVHAQTDEERAAILSWQARYEDRKEQYESGEVSADDFEDWLQDHKDNAPQAIKDQLRTSGDEEPDPAVDQETPAVSEDEIAAAIGVQPAQERQTSGDDSTPPQDPLKFMM